MPSSWSTLPSSPASIIALIRRFAGWRRRLWPTWITTPARSAASAARLAPEAVRASGFSTNTCLPGLGTSDGEVHVRRVRGRDHDTVDADVVQHLVEVSRPPGIRASRRMRTDARVTGRSRRPPRRGRCRRPRPPALPRTSRARRSPRRTLSIDPSPFVPASALRATRSSARDDAHDERHAVPRSSGFVISIGIAAWPRITAAARSASRARNASINALCSSLARRRISGCHRCAWAT